MKRIIAFCTSVVLGISCLAVGALSGCAGQKTSISDFQGILWGTQASEIIRSAQSEDYYLAWEEEGVVTLYGFDSEAALTMGGRILLCDTLEARILQTANALEALTAQLGGPTAETFRDGHGGAVDTWETALESGGTVQFFWVTPNSEPCQLDAGASGPVRITLTAPGVSKEGAEFQGIAWGSSVEEVADHADWAVWFVIQGIVSVSDLPATAVYRFDANGGLSQGEYLIDAGDIENSWNTVVNWLKETYGLSAAALDDQTPHYEAQWNCGSVQISMTYDSEHIHLVFLKT